MQIYVKEKGIIYNPNYGTTCSHKIIKLSVSSTWNRIE